VVTIWQRYLIVGALAVVGYALLPPGPGRDVLFCLVGASGTTAIGGTSLRLVMVNAK